MQLEGGWRGSHRALPFPVSSHQQSNARDQGNSATHRPSSLPGHKTPRQYIDSLQNPDASKKHQQSTYDVQCNSHASLLVVAAEITGAPAPSQDSSWTSYRYPPGKFLPCGAPRKTESVRRDAAGFLPGRDRMKEYSNPGQAREWLWRNRGCQLLRLVRACRCKQIR